LQKATHGNAGRKPVATQMGNQHHRSDGYQLAIAMLRAKSVGEVKEIHSWTAKPFWPQGLNRPQGKKPVPANLDWNLWLGPAATRPFHDCYLPHTWRGWWDFGGGALADMGPHLLDPVVAGLGLGLPNRVAAETDKRFPETAPNWSIVRFQIPSKMANKTLTLSWYDGGKQPPRKQTGLARLPSHGSLVIGSAGKLFIPQLGGMPIFLGPKNERRELPQLKVPKMAGHHQQWLKACRSGKKCSSDFQYGGTLTAIALLGNLSVRSGLPFRFDVKRKRTSSDKLNELMSGKYRPGFGI